MRIFISRCMGCVIVAAAALNAARADIPTTGYLYQFYQDNCNNGGLVIPGDGESKIASKSYAMALVDILNQSKTTYAANTDTDAILSAGFLPDTFGLLTNASTCCPGGRFDATDSACKCDTWSDDTSGVQCLDAGKYLNGSSCSTCPSGYTCPAGTSGKIYTEIISVQCLDFGEYRSNNTCIACEDGYLCPANQNKRENCIVGSYCVDSVAIECEYGPNQCPYANHGFQPDTIACDDAVTATDTGANVQCLDAGKYLNGSSCSNCPSGYTCPAGTSGKIYTEIVTTQCLDFGEYRSSSNTCVLCEDGYLCPAAQNKRENCVVGSYCVDSVAHECEYGARQCPYVNHAFQPDKIACDDALTFSE